MEDIRHPDVSGLPRILAAESQKGPGDTRGHVAIFFRKRELPFEPAVHWVFADDIDASYEELQSLGANIVEPLETKPWGLRQFTVWTATSSTSTMTNQTPHATAL